MSGRPSPALEQATRRIVRALGKLTFGPPVACVYNPLEYARRPYAEYLSRFASGRKEWLFLGMNPGPFGMAQTGVPFGEVEAVRDFLGVHGRVEKPRTEHPKRPVTGFDCTRSEVSGRRFWGWCRERFGTADSFFARAYVHNYCPLVFMTETGSNITPDKLEATEREPLFAACDDYLRAIVTALRPELVVGIGTFAEARARAALAEFADGHAVRFGRIPHPSPASPLANRGWSAAANDAMAGLGIGT